MRSFFLIFLILQLFINTMVFGDTLIITNKFSIENNISRSKSKIKIDPFYWSYMFFEEIALDLGLHEKLTTSELLNISFTSYNSLLQTKPVQITVFEHNNIEKNLNITIGYRHNKSKYVLTSYANVHEITRRIINQSQAKFFWGKGFVHSHGRLINAKYISNEKKLNKNANNTIKAQYYLYDATTLNNDEIPNMLRNDINKAKDFPFLSYIIKAQLYMSTKKLKQAKDILDKIKIQNCKNQKIINLFHITQLEYEFMKKVYNERKKNAKKFMNKS